MDANNSPTKAIAIFTDDDLARLKNLLLNYESKGATACYSCSRFRQEARALLARLKAAEGICEFLRCDNKDMTAEDEIFGMDRLMLKWLEVSGRKASQK